MTDPTLDELAEELAVFAEPEKTGDRSPREVRIIAGFEDIQRFVDRHGGAPRHGEDRDIIERLYAVRLDRLRALDDGRSLLAPFDRQGLLTGPQTLVETANIIDDDELLAELAGTDNDGDITALRHVRTSADKRAAEEIAQRKPCADFETFKPLFDLVKRELKDGVRRTHAVHTLDELKLAEIQKGEFFIVDGQIAFVADVGEEIRTKYERRDSRLRVIYDNGTESDVLQRSFQRALHRDIAARLVTNPDAGPLFSDREAVANRHVLHKIGVTGRSNVATRFANARNEPTFLLADVEIVATYDLYNVNRVKLENLIHRVFDPARLDIEIKDRFGKPVVPREWFLVPVFVVDEVVERIKDGTITQYLYDPKAARLVKTSDPQSKGGG
jgi:T5orf172 domain